MSYSSINGTYIMKYKPHLLTCPRSGSHHFTDLFYKKTGLNIEKSHAVNWMLDENNAKQRTIITIVRDPRETILSYIALDRMSYVSTINEVQRAHHIATEYILMYNFLYEYADYVIDFKDLVENPDAVTEKIFNLLEIKEEDHHFFSKEPDVKSKDYIPSSKILREYKEESINDLNIELCYFYYRRLLEKKIVI